MKKLLLLTLLMAGFAAEGWAQGGLDFLRELGGEYPHDVRLFENGAFRQRLTELLGGRRCRFLVGNFDVQTPAEIDDGVFVIAACKAHDCLDVAFIIAYDFARDALSAGIRRKGKDTIYTERDNAPVPTKIKEWANLK